MNSGQFCIILYVFVTVLLLVTDAKSPFYTPNTEDPNHPGFCFYKDEIHGVKTQFYMKPGQKRKHPNYCFRIDCTEDLGIDTQGCVIADTGSHCKYIIGDASKPYPHCCTEYIC